jgi:hypothetical protein
MARSFVFRGDVSVGKSTQFLNDGTNKFGDTPDDTHSFTGSVFFSGSVEAPTFNGVALTTNSGSGNFLNGAGNYVTPTAVADSIRKTITQVGHTFVSGEVVAISASVYVKPLAVASFDGEVIGVVESVSGNDFDVVCAGKIDVSGSYLDPVTSSCVYFVSPTSAGQITTTAPTNNNDISKPILIGDSSTTGLVVNYRGMQILSGSAGEATTADSASYVKFENVDFFNNTGSGDAYLSGSLTVDNYIDLIPQIPDNLPHKEGRIFYDSNNNALSYYNDEPDVILNVGQELWFKGVNKTGGPILDGTVVYVSGSQGNRPVVWPADADFNSSRDTIGVATHDIEDNAEGYITEFGLVNNIDLSAFAAGDVLYLSGSAGEFTNVEPVFPTVNHKVRVGYVTDASNNGQLLVSVKEFEDFAELYDTKFNNPQEGDVVVYSGSYGWYNSKTVPSASYAETASYLEGGFPPADSANSIKKTITQVGHSFVRGEAVAISSSVYVKPLATSSFVGEVIGVAESIDGDDVDIVCHGHIDLSGSYLDSVTSSCAYFISPTVAGQLTTTAPTNIGEVSKPILIGTTTTTGIVNNYRGMEISDASTNVYISQSGQNATLGDVVVDSINVGCSASFNTLNDDCDFTIYQSGSSFFAYQYDASENTHTFSGSTLIIDTDNIQFGSQSIGVFGNYFETDQETGSTVAATATRVLHHSFQTAENPQGTYRVGVHGVYTKQNTNNQLLMEVEVDGNPLNSDDAIFSGTDGGAFTVFGAYVKPESNTTASIDIYISKPVGSSTVTMDYTRIEWWEILNSGS